MLDHYHWINNTRCLEIEDIQAIARKVWYKMAIKKFTIIDSPEKMRDQGGYSIIFPQVKEKKTHSEHNQNNKKTKDKAKQR